MHQPITLLLKPYHHPHHYKFHAIIYELSVCLKNILFSPAWSESYMITRHVLQSFIH